MISMCCPTVSEKLVPSDLSRICLKTGIVSINIVSIRMYLEGLSLISIYGGVEVDTEKTENYFGPFESYRPCYIFWW